MSKSSSRKPSAGRSAKAVRVRNTGYKHPRAKEQYLQVRVQVDQEQFDHICKNMRTRYKAGIKMAAKFRELYGEKREFPIFLTPHDMVAPAARVVTNPEDVATPNAVLNFLENLI